MSTIPAGPTQRTKELYPAIVIGLGGTGRHVVRVVKNELLRTYGGVPPHVALLSIDTHRHEGGGDGLPSLDASESVDLSLPDPVQTISQLDRDFPWFPKDQNLRQLIRRVNENGAGGSRPIGRLLLDQNWNDLYMKISRKVEDVKNALRNYEAGDTSTLQRFRDLGLADFKPMAQTPLALVAFNVVGGTGCGGFLSLAYLLRALPGGRNMKSLAFVSLPPVTSNKVALFQQASAALRELQHFSIPDVHARESTAFEITGLFSQQVLQTYPDAAKCTPFEAVGIARPDSDAAENVSAIEKGTGLTLARMVATPVGVAWTTKIVDAFAAAQGLTTTGQPPVFFAYGHKEYMDETLDAASSARTLLADFILDDMSGESNAGEEKDHAAWGNAAGSTILGRLQILLGLPTSSVGSSTPLDIVTTKSVCGNLITKFLERIQSQGFTVGGKKLSSFTSEKIRDAILADPLILSRREKPNELAAELSKLDGKLQPARDALDATVKDLVVEAVLETEKRISELFLGGCSVRELHVVLGELSQQLESLNDAVSGLKPQTLGGPFSINGLKALIAQFAGAWAKQKGIVVFEQELLRAVDEFVTKSLVDAAIRYIGGTVQKNANDKFFGLSGHEYRWTQGTRGCICELQGILGTVKARLDKADEELSSRISARGMRAGLTTGQLPKLYQAGKDSYNKAAPAYRTEFLSALGTAGSLWTLAQDTLKMEKTDRGAVAVADKIMATVVVAGSNFNAWWERARPDFTPQFVDGNLSARFNMNTVSHELPAAKPSAVLATFISGTSDETIAHEIATLVDAGRADSVNDPNGGNGVSVLFARGLVSIACVDNIDALTNVYATLDEAGLQKVHAVQNPARLTPIRVDVTDTLFLYVSACAMGWIKRDGQRSVYEYRPSVRSVDTETATYTYSTRLAYDDGAGPVAALRAPIQPGEDALTVHRAETTRGATCVAEHVEYRLKQLFLDQGLPKLEREERQDSFLKLLVLFHHHELASQPLAEPWSLPEGVIKAFTAVIQKKAPAFLQRPMDVNVIVDSVRSARGSDADEKLMQTFRGRAEGRIVDLEGQVAKLLTDRKVAPSTRFKIVSALKKESAAKAIEAAEECKLDDETTNALIELLSGS